jgi:hypothetical protein
VEGVRDAPLEALAEIDGMNQATAEKVKAGLCKKKK